MNIIVPRKDANEYIESVLSQKGNVSAICMALDLLAKTYDSIAIRLKDHQDEMIKIIRGAGEGENVTATPSRPTTGTNPSRTTTSPHNEDVPVGIDMNPHHGELPAKPATPSNRTPAANPNRSTTFVQYDDTPMGIDMNPHHGQAPATPATSSYSSTTRSSGGGGANRAGGAAMNVNALN